MNELELKYGCNPNQKPAKIFMQDGRDLPVTVLNGKPGYINFLTLSTAGSWCANSKPRCIYRQPLLLNTSAPPAQQSAFRFPTH